MFWLVVVALGALRFWHLTADFPDYTTWSLDQAKFTDEGWWAGAAINHQLTGHWTVPGDYNAGVALPVWPALLAILFRWTGVSLVATRALNVALSLGTASLAWWIMRRVADERSGTVTALLLVASPFAFVFSRLATLDTFILFEFCLILLVLFWLEQKPLPWLALLAPLITAMVLTKTTAVVLLPGIFCVAWMRRKMTLASALQLALAMGVAPFLLLAGYRVFVDRAGFGADYRYFYAVNGMQDVDWGQSLATLAMFLRNSFWLDRFLYPLAVGVLAVSVVWLRDLWRNPLFTGSWVVIACQAAFIFRRQDDYAPRYWLVFLVPVIFCVTLTINALRHLSRKLYLAALCALAVIAIINTTNIWSYVAAPTYQFHNAAMDIKRIVAVHPESKPLMLGASAAEVSLATGIPSVNDVFGEQELGARVERYRPGWFLVWNKIGAENKDALLPYALEWFASYPMFDDGDRDELILYRIVDSGGK